MACCFRSKSRSTPSPRKSRRWKQSGMGFSRAGRAAGGPESAHEPLQSFALERTEKLAALAESRADDETVRQGKIALDIVRSQSGTNQDRHVGVLFDPP